MAEAKELFAFWIDAVAAALRMAAARAMPQRRIPLKQSEAGDFTARVVSKKKGAALPQATFRLGQAPALTEEWRAALRGSRLEIHMRADQVLFRTIDFPKQATDFLDGMVRAQIDRLTPWTADNAVYGLTAPVPAANERVALTLAATSRQAIQPLLDLATDLGAASVEGLIEPPDAENAARPIRIFEQKLSGPAGLSTDMPRLLRLTLLGAGVTTAVMLAVSTYLGGAYDDQRQELQQRVSQRRAALHIDRPGSSATTLLAKRKQTSPSSVMVLEAISRVLPDTTYVTELRIDTDKMQIVGLTRNAPSLIRLLEQSPQFSRATFFAPTTRDQNDPGERFHIEAHVIPYFGTGS
ncbi:Fimbrial assembly [Nitrobacter hamburgensis X14]|uniref:Fimbrial assembly n=1 Tax=Nitrobacter hamburgensis (strain DSM 10229 / NCIMB 13809 / X14) TaxID=323097 RepID=Q1QQ80_NITHX|nr:PilN domain-containing protein [Nitrobacter hamburgensis]ABE61617.1 Fimbrial assembly [Nitrobacter hamburgensis X14]